MNPTHNQPRVHTITEDQALFISIRQSEARALLYLLGTVVAKEPLGVTNEPGYEEQEGIYSLVVTVGNNLTEAFDSALRSGSPNAAHQTDNQAPDSGANGRRSENAPESNSTGGNPEVAQSRPAAAASGMQGDAMGQTTRGGKGGAA